MKARVILVLSSIPIVVALAACSHTTKDSSGIIDPPQATATSSGGRSSDLPEDTGNRAIIQDTDIVSGDLPSSANSLQPVFFQYDRYDFQEDQIAVLQKNGTILLSSPSREVVIQGHCDERGTDEYNLALGDRRARAVREYLIGMGVSSDRLRTISFGENKPFADGHTEEAWSENRRAQFVESP